MRLRQCQGTFVKTYSHKTTTTGEAIVQ